MAKTITLIRQIVGRNPVIFNDRLEDGRRSIKIGYIGSSPFYKDVIRSLEKNGRKVETVVCNKGRGLRLHVTE